MNVLEVVVYDVLVVDFDIGDGKISHVFIIAIMVAGGVTDGNLTDEEDCYRIEQIEKNTVRIIF